MNTQNSEEGTENKNDSSSSSPSSSKPPLSDSEDFILVGYNVNADPHANPILKFLANQFPRLIGDLLSAFGIAPVVTLVLVYFLVKGVAVTAFNMSTLPLFKDGFNVTDGATYQRITTITSLAWPMKPVIGLLSDTLPILAFRKRYYLTGAAVSCVSLLCAICLFNNNNNNNSSSSSDEKDEGLPAAVWFTALFMFCTNLCFATMDLLCEAVYSRLYILRPAAGTSIVSLVWGLVMVSGVPGAFVVGPLADAHRPFLALFVIASLVAVTIVPFYRNWLGEKPLLLLHHHHQNINNNNNVTEVISRTTRRIRNRLGFRRINSRENEGSDYEDDHENTKKNEQREENHQNEVAADDDDQRNTMTMEDVELKDTHKNDGNNNEKNNDVEKIRNNINDGTTTLTKTDERNLRLQSIAMGIICPLTACSAMMLEIWSPSDDHASATLAFKKLIVPICSACILIFLGSKWLPRKIFKAMTYMMLKEASYASLAGALDFFYVADEKCVPGGPKFSYTYYQTTTTIVGSIFGAVGSFLFHKYFVKQNFQKIFWTTTTLRIIASFFDIVLVERWNVKYLGMSDEAAYMFGDAIVYPVTATLDFMPAVMLTAQLCPKNYEAIMYSVLAGFSNFGQGISGFLGAYLTDVFGIRTSSSSGKSHLRHHLNISNLTSLNFTHYQDNISFSPSSTTTCDFSNLSLLIFFAHGILPALTLPLVEKMVPKTLAQADDEENVNDDDGATTGTIHRPTAVISNQQLVME